MRPAGIGLRLSAAFMAVSLVIAGFVFAAIRMHIDTIERAALLEAEHFARIVAYGSTDNALNNPTYLQAYVDGLTALHGRGLGFVDINKVAVADADKDEVGKKYSRDPGNEVGQTLRDGRTRSFVERNERHPQGARQIVVPLRVRQTDFGSTIVGAAIVEYTHLYDGLVASGERNLYMLGVSGVACVLLTMLFGLRLAAQTAGRLKTLQHGADSIAAGNYETQVSVASRDEVGRLGGAFNAMAAALGTSRDKLVRYASELEQRVESRTSDLTQANMQMRIEASERAEAVRALIESDTEQKRAVTKIKRLNRVYAVLSGINTLIVRVRDREELFREACRIAVEAGGLPMTWIGIVDPAVMRIGLVASAGMEGGLLDAVKSRLASDGGVPLGNNMATRAVRGKTPGVSNDAQNDPALVLNSNHITAGVRSMAMLPLIVADEAVGVLGLYSAELGFFDEQEMKLFTELAGDIAFAIDHIDQEKRLDYLAYYDVLTGLANRSLFLERVAQYMRSASAGRHKLALFLIDLERFKNINDSLGRPAGDALLQQVAQWLTRRFGDGSLLARVGADHFAVVLPEVRQEGDLTRLVEGTAEAFMQHPFHLNDAIFRIPAKAGVALFPDDGTDAETLFKHTEAALKKAKASGERYLFYTQKMTETVAAKLTLENQLRQALDREEFVLHYQPKVGLATGTLTGVEALIRWNDPRTGLVPPGRFIPVLEETGLISEVGRWALRKAIEDYLRWCAAGLPAVRIAVNVSPLQLRNRGFVAEIAQVVGIDSRAAAGLELEITESLIMEDVKHSIAALQAIRAMGLRIAIDDFGTGFSSLSYLSKLPVDTLKIDRSFVTDMTAGPEGLALVSTIINLAHSLKLKVVAEGVETEEQSRLLRLLSCDEMQGYLFSKPLPGDVFEARFLVPVQFPAAAA